MIAILEKSEHNIDFHQIVDFVEASHIRIETTNEETKILATIDGFNEFSSNIATAMGEGLGTPTEPHHTPSPEAQQSPHHDLSSSLHPTSTTKIIPTETPTEIPTLRQYFIRATRIAQFKALPTAADELASLLRADSQGEAFSTVSGLEAGQDRENIIKTSALPYDHQGLLLLMLMRADLEISNLKARIKLLEDKDKGSAEPSGDDDPINVRSLETGEEACVERSTERGSNDTEEMVNVLTSIDAANILTSGVQDVSVPPTAEVSTVGVSTASGLVPTASGLVPTISAIFTTASVVTPNSRRKGERVKRKGLKLEQGSAKKMKTSEDVSEEDLKEMMQLMPAEERSRDLHAG
nr:hypothetical protein [Tanacetum cinerariifolium]